MSGLEVATLMSELQQEYEAKKNAFESDERRQMLERLRDELVAKRAALAAVEAEVDSLALPPEKRQRV
jgi:polyhydroxyalkanoate synthesis regulator phasin